MRVAAVDLGTNSTRLLIADIGAGVIEEVRRGLVITRLGERVDERSHLSDAAMRRVRSALRGYRALMDDAGVELAVAAATSAVRDAKNGAFFLAAIEAEFGVETRLLSGDEEARLTYRGVISDRTSARAQLVVIDVGGGSTEVTVGEGDAVTSVVSIDAGCVRATEQWLGEGPIDVQRLATTRQQLDELFARGVGEPPPRLAIGVAVAGTATTLAALDLGLSAYDPALIHGHLLRRSAIEHWIQRLAPLAPTERCQLGCLEPGRSGVIVAGALILASVTARLRLDAVEVSERDLLHGLALSAADE